jgi:hypothetical protein
LGNSYEEDAILFLSLINDNWKDEENHGNTVIPLEWNWNCVFESQNKFRMQSKPDSRGN